MAIISRTSNSLNQIPMRPANLAQAIEELGLDILDVIEQAQDHFGLTSTEMLEALADIILAAPATGFGVIHSDGVIVSHFLTDEPVVAGPDLPAWFTRIADETGVNGDEVSITRVDPAIIATKNW